MAFKSSPDWSSAGPKLKWPRKTLKDHINYVTHGRFEDLPQSTSKTVRIFLSSTFTDTYTERNLLMKNVYPKLQKLCKEKYDLDFQVVDMRWGIRNEASVDHSASDLCMKEIETCKNVSVGPTFVALLSHRYGGRLLPSKISTDEMDIITGKITSEEDKALVQEWYKLDENAIPSEHILQPIVGQAEMEDFLVGHDESEEHDIDYDSDDSLRHIRENKKKPSDKTKVNYNELVSHGKDTWSKAETQLLNIIRTAVKEAIKEGAISEENSQKYFYSITEEEIRKGLVNEPKRTDRCLVFMRELENINMKHEKAERFVEKTENHEINTEVDLLLTKLKTELIPSHLPADNIYNFKTQWSDNEGINEEDHKDYLKLFCDTFEKAILDLIERGYNNTSVEAVGKIYPEVLEHSHQAVQKVERFHGREDILDIIKSYVLSTSEQPLIIHGESGCGKTSVLAKAALQIPTLLGDNSKTSVILRFLGTTPDSSTVYKTLASISQQIITLTGLEKSFPELPQEFSDLKDMFKDILNAVASTQHRVVILLDSLDQLSEANNAYKLLWFPTKLPKGVKLIASTLPEEHDILEKLNSPQMKLDEFQFVEVEDLETTTSHEIIDLWLGKINRQLSDHQKDRVNTLLSHEVRPLYLKLIFDEISNWKSFEETHFSCPTIPACLQRLYKKIETKHGKTLVTKALGFLSASKNGLTQIEIEDILSLDDEVLNDVFEYHTPPIRRLPSILWARIRSDLTEYIVDRDADGAKVMAWYHRQFIQEAHKRYLPGSSAYGSSGNTKKSLNLYKTLADYFAGVWVDKPKPFQYTAKQMQKLKLKSAEAKENRYVPEQPVVFRSEHGSIDIRNIRYNLRKLSELPSACDAILKHEDYITYIAEHICLNPEFLAAWINNSPWEEISEFMNENARESSYGGESREITKAYKKAQRLKEQNEDHKEEEEFDWDKITKGTAGLILQMSTIQQCLLLSYISVLNNPTYLGPDVAGRLLMFYGIMDGITDWIRYTDKEGRKLCALISPHMQLETAGSELMFVINNHIGPVQHSIWAAHDSNLCLSVSEKLVGVSLEAGQIIIDTRPRSMPKGDRFNKIVATSIDDEKPLYFVSLMENSWVYIFDGEGEVLSIIDFDANLSKQKSFKITGMVCTRNVKKDSEFSLHVFDSSKNVILSAIDVLESEIKYKETFKTDSNVLELITDEPDRYGGDLEINALTIIDKKGVLYLIEIGKKGEGIQRDKKSFSLPAISTSNFSYHSEGASGVIGFETGNVCIFRLKKCTIEMNLDYLKPIYLFSENMQKPKYGIPHFVQHHAPMESSGESSVPLGIACTNTHLIAFASRNFLSDDYDSDYDDTDEVELKPLSQNTMKLLCRIRKRYTMAMYTPEMEFIIAARGGSLDIFKIGDPSKLSGVSKLKIQYFTTIDAHGQDVTNILPTDQDMLFMTSSMDSSLKFYMLARAGNIRKYVPNFDRAERDISTIIPGKEYAVTFAKSSRLIHQWEIATGRIRKIFEHPKNLPFLKCAVDDAMYNILAIDSKGNAFLWRIEKMKKEGTTIRRTLLKRKTTAKLRPDNAAVTIPAEAPDPDISIDSSIQFPANTSADDVHMLMFSNTITLIATRTSKDVFLLDPLNEGSQCQVLKDVKGPFQHVLKLKDDRVLFVSGNKVIVYDVNSLKIDDENLKIIDAKGITDIKYIPEEDKIIASSAVGKIVTWTPGKQDDRAELPIQKISNGAKLWKLTPCSDSLCVLVESESYQYALVDIQKNEIVKQDNIVENKEKLKLHTCTPDGKYIVYVVRDKHVHLVRISDGSLLAWYTMYDEVNYITTSPNSWYVLISTSDRRLFVLLIADPDDESHDDRIKYVRRVNPPLTKEQAMSLLGDANEFDSDDDSSDDYDTSDDEYTILKAEKRLKQKALAALGTNVKVLYSSDSSEEEEEFAPKNRNRSKSRMQKEELNNGPQQPVFEGELFTTVPCSIQ